MGFFVGAHSIALAGEGHGNSLFPEVGQINTVTGLLLFFTFFIPGYITTRIYYYYVPSDRPDFSKQVNETVANSAIHYALFGWIVLVAHWNVAAIYGVVLGLPVVEGMFLALITDDLSYDRKSIVRYLLAAPRASPTPWDAFFARERRGNNERGLDVRVHFRRNNDADDADVDVGGFYGKRSFASSYPAPRQLYLEVGYKIDPVNKSGAPISNSAGILVNCEAAQYIVFRRSTIDAKTIESKGAGPPETVTPSTTA